MHKHTLNANDGLMVIREAGETALGDKVPALEIAITESHVVGITVAQGSDAQSHISVRPVRLADGSFMPRSSEEPKLHKDAYFLVRITGPEMTLDVYHQFDQRGKYLE